MGMFGRLFGKRGEVAAGPFMEHPAGAFGTAVEAMGDAVRRLRKMPRWEAWITFCAQGAAEGEGVRFAEIRMLHDKLVVEGLVEVEEVATRAGVARGKLQALGEGRYSVAGLTAEEVARVMDGIFRESLGVKAVEGEGGDYAVGAEW